MRDFSGRNSLPQNFAYGQAPPGVARRNWLVLFVWLATSLVALAVFEYQSVLRGLICGG